MNKFDFEECLDIPYQDDIDSICIIPYEASYFEKVKSLYMTTYRELALSNKAIRKFVIGSIKRSFDKVSGDLKRPEENKLWIVKTSNNSIVGMVGIHIINESSFEIQKLNVAKNYRNKGISTKLYNVLETEGCKLCISRPLTIWLSTISLLDVAESFYKEKGFIHIRKDVYKGYDLDVFKKEITFSVCKI